MGREQMSKDQKNVKILMIFFMMVVISAYFNMQFIVTNLFKVSVQKCLEGFDLIIERDALKQFMQMKLMIQNKKIKNHIVGMKLIKFRIIKLQNRGKLQLQFQIIQYLLFKNQIFIRILKSNIRTLICLIVILQSSKQVQITILLNQSNQKQSIQIKIDIKYQFIQYDQYQHFYLLYQPKVLSQDQINVASSFENFGNVLMIGLGTISILILLFGDPLRRIEIFDILQFQAFLKLESLIIHLFLYILNFKYKSINLVFPQNLYIYSHSSDFVSLIILTLLQQQIQFQQPLKQLIFLIPQFMITLFKAQVSFRNIQLMLICLQIFQGKFPKCTQSFLYILLSFYTRSFNNNCLNSKIFIYYQIKQIQMLINFRNQTIQIKQKIHLSKETLYYESIQTNSLCKHLGFFIQSYFIYYIKYLIRISTNHILMYLSGCFKVVFFLLLLHFKGLKKNLDISKLRKHEGICQLNKKLFIQYQLVCKKAIYCNVR
ncbi:unnamed protein product [Paramecium sonneborni]|uniref:Transmembrane protein n=1 Tax=Paramecium sonneborni TaxID=65129 RepID=A0A8S1LID9_9CILI|nr:unnamed protein product [Paramecium sonneborni]